MQFAPRLEILRAGVVGVVGLNGGNEKIIRVYQHINTVGFDKQCHLIALTRNLFFFHLIN